jgi:hypothetical protein
LVPEFQFQAGNQGRKIRIAAAFSKTCQSSLYMAASCFYGSKGVRNGKTNIIMRMNTKVF